MNKRLIGFVSSIVMFGAQLHATDILEYYSCDFSEGIPTDMTLYDRDGETLHYTMVQRGFQSTDSWISLREEGTENYYAASASRFKVEADKTSIPADDWLVLPEIWMRGGEGKLSWKSRIFNDQSSRKSSYDVRISTTGSRPEDFTDEPIMKIDETDEQWNSYSLDLSQYAGLHIWIAFVNITDNGEILGLDDITITGDRGLAEISLFPGNYATGDPSSIIIGGTLTAGTVEPITSFSATCLAGGKKYEVSYPDLNLLPGESIDFSFPVELDIIYGDSFEYVVSPVVNGVTFDDIVQTTTYLAFLPERRVVIEEATGTWCQYCPMGILAFEILEERYPDTFIPIAIHMIEGVDPMAMDSYANQNIFSGGAPSGWVDRLVYSTHPMMLTRIDNQRTYTTLMGGFETLLLERMAVTPMADVSLTAEISSDGMLSVKSISRYPVNVEDADYRLCFVLTEDHVSGSVEDGYTQMNGYSGAGEILGGYESLPRVIVENLEFNHVARAIYNDYNGIAGSIPSSITAGENYTYEFNHKLPNNIQNNENLNVIAFVLDHSTGEIMNAASIRPATSGVDTISKNGSDFKVLKSEDQITVSSLDPQTEISLQLMDISGRVLDKSSGNGNVSIRTNGLKGLHILKIESNKTSSCRKLIL